MWVLPINKPKKDIRCFAVCRRENGSFYIPHYKVTFTLGVQKLNGSFEEGFLGHNVLLWMPIPEPYTKNKKGWRLFGENQPEKPGKFIICYIQNDREYVDMAYFNEDKVEFYGYDVIAWRKIPNIPKHI